MMQIRSRIAERSMNNTTTSRTAMQLAIAALLAGAGASAPAATEYGRVISSTPVYGEVAVPQRECRDEQQAVAVPGAYYSSGVGALVGAVVGAAVGNGIGAGAGRAAATGIGAVAGAAIGNNVEAAGTPPAVTTTTVRRCRSVTQRENRIIGYDVTYEYAGRRYTTRLAQDPGERVALDVRVAPRDAVPPPAPVYDDAPPAAAPPRSYYYAPPPAVYGAPVYYGPPAVYVAPTIWFGGHWGHRWH
jgi:uncharacterized protein YcfJ